MQISSVNDVKIYNLSHGKSLPEWLSDRKKRQLQKKDVDIQRRIELIQDFEMPTVCTSIKVSKDGQFILATGTYKPRIRCYDTYQLSLKFERCLDSDVVAFDILSDDYSKVGILDSLLSVSDDLSKLDTLTESVIKKTHQCMREVMEQSDDKVLENALANGADHSMNQTAAVSPLKAYLNSLRGI
ncbi:nucleolar protein 10-like [Notothenia coriiceps]|uniref:Nucleolar protein 10-like n=1 Tax=Notothenia coriiceps TaxID=8208 RepID=A0A6I9MUY1_9TELE|nr:PREDICTED: nucleolar protein 10-like [Notothenia coriiceps]